LAERAAYRAVFTSMAGRIVPYSPRFGLARLTVHDCSDEAMALWLSECFGKPPARRA
jgi:hypothetical protein